MSENNNENGGGCAVPIAVLVAFFFFHLWVLELEEKINQQAETIKRLEAITTVISSFHGK